MQTSNINTGFASLHATGCFSTATATIAMILMTYPWYVAFLLVNCNPPVALCKSTPTESNTFDYIVVGGGTAGLVIASRLSEDPHVTVAIIEAGNFEKNNPNVTNTTVIGIAKNTALDWEYESEPQAFLGNKSLIWSAGKGLGGSSLINGMTYMRPASSQMDLWLSYGLEIDWNVLFNATKAGETFQQPSSKLTATGACYEESLHGLGGPLATCITPHMVTGDVHEIFNSTFKALGIPPRCDLNGGDLRGFAVQMVTQDGYADVREDAARAYYYPFEGRPNLVAMVETTGTRILWSTHNKGSKRIAKGVEAINHAGEIVTIHANREVILSAGAIRTPAILEHSGAGNPKILSRFSIPTIIDLPAVGENFQDQTVFAVLASPKHNYTGFPVFVAHTSLHDLFRNQTSTIYESTLAKIPDYAAQIAASNGGASTSATQERILRSQLDVLMHGNTPTSEIVPLVLGSVLGGVFWPLQPFSRGSVHIASSNASAPPAIDARFFSIDFDAQVAIVTAKFVREFLTTEPVASIVDPATIQPSFELVPQDASDEVWMEWLRGDASLSANYHHLGTCAMLPREMGGVVDNEFRVYGTENVRVVDMSVVPVQVAGHSTALLYGVAEWASRKIKGTTTWI